MKKRVLALGAILCSVTIVAFVTLFAPAGDQHSRERRDVIYAPVSQGTEDDPHAQAEMEWLIVRDPVTNTIPENIRRREAEFSKTLPVRREGEALDGSGRTLVWTERGPNNIGGRTRVFACDVSNPDILLAGSVAGGIWKSVNDGASWNLTMAPWQVHTTTCIAQDIRPGRTSTWYVGTGEFRGSTNNDTRWGSLYRGDGIFKSTDNGSSWFLLPSTSSGTPNVTDPFDYIWTVATDPSDAILDVVYAATYIGIYRSSDGGGSWTRVLPADSSFTDVAVTPGGVVYAFTRNGGVTSLWRSANGVDYVNIAPASFPTSTGRVVIGIAPSNPNVVYYFVQISSSHQFWKYTYLSGNGTGTGGTWENRSANLPSGLSTQTGYDQMVHVKTDDEHFVLIGGTNLYRTTNGFASSTGTATIGGYPYWPGQNHHPDLHSGFFRPGNPNVYYSGHDGGLSKTVDVGATSVTWSSLNNGYNVTQFYSVSIPPDSGSTMIMAGAQDNGTLLGDAPGSSDWIMVYGGDGTVVKVSPQADNRLYTQYQNGPMHRQTYAGANVTTINPSGATNQLFVNPILLDPNNSSLLYYAAGRTSPSMTSGIWRNDNAPNATTTSGWTALMVSDVSPATGYTRRVSALGLSKANVPNVLYYGTTDGIVRRLDNANGPSPTATTITPPGLNGGTSAGGFVRAIAVDPANSDRALVAFGNYNFRNLWYTTDGGATWDDVEGNLAGPSGPSVRWASMFYVEGTMQVFLGTSIGLLSTSSLNGMATVWTQEAPVTIGNILIAMLDYRESDRTLAVGTHARGVFTAQFDSPVSAEEPMLSPSAFALGQNYPNPFNPSTTIAYDLPVGGHHVTLTVYDITGREVATLADGQQGGGRHIVQFDASGLSSGVYLYTLRAGSFTETRKLVLLR